MEVIRQIARDIGGEPSRIEPWYLWPIRQRRWNTEFVAGKETADVHLIVGCAGQTVVVVSTVKVELCPEIVIQPEDPKVVILRNSQIGLESADVAEPGSVDVATRLKAVAFAWQGLKLVPHLRYKRADADSPRIAQSVWARRALPRWVSDTIQGHWGGV